MTSFWVGGALVTATSFNTKAVTAVAPAAAAAFSCLPFMVYLFSHFVLWSLRREGVKKNNSEIYRNLKKRPREQKELSELICSESWGKREKHFLTIIISFE